MKFAIFIIATVVTLISSACMKLTQGPAGVWEGMDGTDLISLTLFENGQCSLKKPAQDLAGTWSTVAPGKAVVHAYYSGRFEMKSNTQAVLVFNGRTVQVNRVAVQPPPPVTAKAPAKKIAPPQPRKESYHLNEIP